MSAKEFPGRDAVQAKGWLHAHKWLLARRAAQLGFLALFLIGPLTGFWLVKGNISSSLTLDILPLSDPLIHLQSWLAGHVPETTVITGALIVLAAYALIGGRMYCSWVCPVNIITDAAHWLRHRLDIRGGIKFHRSTRYWILAAVLVVSAIGGVVAWELINPVTVVYRAVVFGVGAAWLMMLALFLFDLVIAERGWCSHLCPVGAFYSLPGAFSILRVRVPRRAACNNCMDCFAVCPESHVITPALRSEDGHKPVISEPNCTNCGRCIDVCSLDVFEFGSRFDSREKTQDEPGEPPVLHNAA